MKDSTPWSAHTRRWHFRSHHLNHAARLTFTVLSKELRETHFRAGLHCRMNEGFNAMVGPHSPLALPISPLESRREVDLHGPVERTQGNPFPGWLALPDE